MAAKNDILRDKDGNQIFPATMAEQVSYDGKMNVKQAIKRGAVRNKVAPTVASMTDKEQIYVYTGTEDGYTFGNWYYWNGTAWTSGGAYNAVEVNTDGTLTEEGAPADAKATGDKLDKLKSDLDDLTYEGTKHYKSKSEQGYISSSGDLNLDTNSNYRRTSDYIDMSNVNSVVFSMPNGTTGIYAEYDENKTFIQRVNISDGTLITTSKFIKFAFYNVNGMTEELFDTCYSIQGKVYFNEKIKSLEEKCTRINNTELKEVVDCISVITEGSDESYFLRYNIAKGDKFKIKVNNYTIGTELRIGTHTVESGSGFTEVLFDASNLTSTSQVVIVEANIDALYFKVYAPEKDTKITIEKLTDKSVNDAGYYSLFYSYKIKEKNVAEYYKCPFNDGDEIEIELNNPTASSGIVIGIVSEEGASGFERVIFNSVNLPVGSFKIKHNALSDYGYIKVFSTENVVLKFAKKIHESDVLSKIGSVIVHLREISTTNSYFEHSISVGDYYQAHLSNVPAGCNILLGSNSVDSSGFTETFVSIMDANETEYNVTFKATIDETAFKCWANTDGVKITLTSFAFPISVSGGYKGCVALGENVSGGMNDYCVAIGSNTLHSNTGIKNISIGNDNMGDCTGNDNTSTGYHAMFRNTSGNCNSALGSESQDDNTTGNNNTSAGFCSLQRNNTGSNNVAIGAFALEGIYENRYDPENLKSVSNNVAIGANALVNAESGSNNNTAVGHNAMSTQKQYNNCIAIGKDADCTKNNQMVLGSSAITEVVFMGNKKLIFNSDGTVTWEQI